MDKKLKFLSQTQLETETQAKTQSQTSTHFNYNANKSVVTSTEEVSFLIQSLEEIDFLNHKEKKANKTGQSIPQNTIAKINIKTSAIFDHPLAILGRCGIPGHIVHFFNLRLEIEKHIKVVEELGDPRFVEAYLFLKNNPATEAVYVYERHMMAFHRSNGRLVGTPI